MPIVRATKCTQRFVGNEHPSLNNAPLEVPVGVALTVSDDLAAFLGTIRHIQVEVETPLPAPPTASRSRHTKE